MKTSAFLQAAISGIASLPLLGYTLPGPDGITGYGTTANVSSRGFLFQCDRALPAGIRINFWIDWPVRLNEQVGLRLHGTGSIVRTDGNYIAVETIE